MKNISAKGKSIIAGATVVLLFLLSGYALRGQEINHWETAVMASDNWRYYIGLSADPDPLWAGETFNDSGWLSGPGGIGYGDNDDGTVIAATPSVFIRTKFNIADKSVIGGAVLHVDFDDGFVAYLNGHEIARANMQPYPYRPHYSDLALNANFEAQLPSGGKPAMFIVNNDTLEKYLHNGQNTLALQVHNSSAGSSDLSSTTFFSLGITDNSNNYREVPAWFTNPYSGYTSNLPIVAIETGGQAINNAARIIAWCKVIDNGSGQPNSFLQSGTDYEGNIGIKIRGQSSQMFPKKSYSVELWNDAGADSSASLLGMPKEEDWVLHAHYSDKSMLRNAITFMLGRKLGGWQPRVRYCTVFLNGEYIGIYLLMENIKRGTDRLNISKLNPYETSGDDLTGGYIVKVDKTGGLRPDEFFTPMSANFIPGTRYYNFTYVYPDAEVIASEQRNYIKNYITQLEDILNSSIFKDPVNGYRKYMDINSFVDFQIMQELSNNVDGYRYSTFFHKEKDSDGGKLRAGPLWDFDLCYGNVDYSPINLSTSGWLYTHYGPTEGQPMHWWSRLMLDPGYKRNLVFRWRALREGPFHTDSVLAAIDSIVTYLGPAVDQNFSRWPILGTYVWPNYFIGSTHEAEVNWLKYWIIERLNWMDSNMPTLDEIISEEYDGKFLMFPNPVESDMTVIFNLVYTREVTIGIFDMSGRKVFEYNHLPVKWGYQEVDMNLGSLGKGIYVLQIRQGKSVIGVKKLIKE